MLTVFVELFITTLSGKVDYEAQFVFTIEECRLGVIGVAHGASLTEYLRQERWLLDLDLSRVRDVLRVF